MPETISNGVAALLASQAADVAGTSNPLDVLTPWVNIGIAGILLIMFVSRKFVVPEWVLRDAEARHAIEVAAKDKRIADLETRLQSHYDVYVEKVVPAMVGSVDVARELLDREREQSDRPNGRNRPDRG